jgi:hypothetical protein
MVMRFVLRKGGATCMESADIGGIDQAELSIVQRGLNCKDPISGVYRAQGEGFYTLIWRRPNRGMLFKDL